MPFRPNPTVKRGQLLQSLLLPDLAYAAIDDAIRGICARNWPHLMPKLPPEDERNPRDGSLIVDRKPVSPNVRMPTLSAIFQLRAIFRPMECLTGHALYLPRAVLRGEDIRTRPRSPSRMPPSRGIGVLFGVRSRPQQRDRVLRRSSRGPRRTEGCGEVRRGQRWADAFPKNQHQPHGNKAMMPIRCRSASRHVRQGCRQRVCPATLGHP
jgi:hypothetical protein